MKLSDKTCKTAKAKKKAYKLADGGGLYLEIMPNGSKCWRLKYRYLNKEKRLALGVYPVITLADAREGRDRAKKLLVQGIDPSGAKKAEKREAIRNAENTFKAVALEWHEKQKGVWSANHAQNVTRRFEMDIFPYIGNRPIADIDPPELLEVLRRIEKRGALDVTARVKQICSQVFRYGIATGLCQRDPSADLRGALKPNRSSPFACIDIKEMPEFLDKLEKNEARLYHRTIRAIKLLMLTFVRTNELINATWEEFDLDNAIWEIPGWRMKMRNPHIVPLSRQTIALLREQKEETGHLSTPWVFPSQVRPKQPMSNNTILFAIGRMGYKKRMTGHGFRALAMSNIKEKLGYRHEVVDRQLAHVHKSKIDRAYDRAQFLDERTKMMQEWADYLDALANGDKVIQGNFKKNSLRA
ncbi:MAG: integrase arm-type DNA-binding domain-containing protein [Alphaproteobacteria bacterium]|nr:integrase arm-type DNA-binding domain-containing protein [Alphaproteobacteria bacterium]